MWWGTLGAWRPLTPEVSRAGKEGAPGETGGLEQRQGAACRA